MLIVIGKTIAVFVLLLLSVLMYIWFLRKVIAKMQNRIGPDRAGPFGLLQSLADGIKLFFKEQSEPNTADRRIFRLAPYLALLPAFLAFSIVPIGGVVTIAGHQTFLQLADLPFGILWLLAMSGLGLYGVLLAGLVVGLEVPAARLGARVGAAPQLRSRVRRSRSSACSCSRTRSRRAASSIQQGWDGFESIFNGDWYWLPAIVALVIFVIAAVAETNHPPFDLVEAEQELTGGFFTEYTGIRFAIFYLAEFMNLITMCGDRGDALLRRPVRPRPRLPRRQRLVQRVDHAGVLVHVQGDRAALRHGVAARLVAAAALRPAHGARLEVPHRDRVPLGDDLRRRRRRQGGGLVDVDRPARRDRRRPRRRRRPSTPRCPEAARVARGDRRRWAWAGSAGSRSRCARSGARKVTERFPMEKRPKPVRFHGRHVLNRYEDGMEKCIGCELCAGVCPAKCIYVRGADNPPDAPVSPGERYGFVYEINYLRCIHCDLCVEACPTEAITETKLFEFSFTNREDAIYTKTELLVDDDGRARRQPWELWLGGEDDDTSAWMRATAPSGQAVYEGRVGWSGELGFGVRPPEVGQSADRARGRSHAAARRAGRRASTTEHGGH